MSHIHIQSPDEAGALIRSLGSATRIALDCEAAGFHRYADALCLVQVTVDDATYVVDPLAFDPTPLLKEAVESRDVGIVMHGADFDLRLLMRDLGIRVRGLVDTQISASLLGEEALGLASLLESRLGVTLSKKYQRADWAARPLTEGMLEYAASDTRHLEALSDILERELERAGRLDWAREEWEALEAVADDALEPDEPEDPVVRVKGARHLPLRQLAALRAALQWRDRIARARDKATFRVIGDKPLVEAAMSEPRRVEELLDIQGFPKGLAREEGKALIAELRSARELSEEVIEPYPRGARRGPGRPPPELESLVDKLKQQRNRAAERVGLPRGTLLPNAVILEIARTQPQNAAELAGLEGMRNWRVDVVGEELLRELRRG